MCVLLGAGLSGAVLFTPLWPAVRCTLEDWLSFRSLGPFREPSVSESRVRVSSRTFLVQFELVAAENIIFCITGMERPREHGL